MKTPIRFLAMLFGSLFVIAGSSQASASAFGPPPGDNVNINVSASSIGTNSTATLTVTVTRRNGDPETDGTIVTATVSPPTIGTVAGVAGGGTSSGNTSSLTGGVASFVFIAGNTTGPAQITFTVPPVNGHPTSVTASTTITVIQGSGNNPSLQLSTSATSLPQNPWGVGAQQDGSLGFPSNYLGSPFIAEVTVQWRGLITDQPVNGKVAMAITPTTVAALSTLDDPTTIWTGETLTPPTVAGNEFLTLVGSGSVNVNAGVGTIFIHANDVPGTATLTVSATDPDTNQTISSQLTITVVGASNGMPATVTLSQSSAGVYINGGNGPQSKVLTASVTDSSGARIANPASGVNNIQFQITGPTGSDATLYAVGASGNLEHAQIGQPVKTVTYNGIANISFLAGKAQGPVQVQATVDGSDNNVDNGISNAVTATTTVVVSDGQLYSLTITSPVVNAIAVNGITPSGSTSSGGSSTTPTIPLQPDATYSLTVSAIATDRQGNPVPPGTPIRFGIIDSPQSPNFTSTLGCSGANDFFLGYFQICGNDGAPMPGQPMFTAPTGHFTSAGGGAGPGDTLVVFGKQWHGAPAGNDDLESALPVIGVVNDTQLFTLFPFNLDDTSLSSSGPAAIPGPLPYIIGRASIGNINSPVTTDSNGRASITGVATTTLNYPVSQLGKSVVIWAQGVGNDPNVTTGTGTRLVTDAIVTGYPALAKTQIIVSPSPIPGNATANVQVCIVDALSVPIPGVQFDFAFGNLGIGTGTVNTISGSGAVDQLTDAGGCVVVSVSTIGLPGSSSSGGSSSGTPTLTFSTGAGSASTTTNIVVSGGPILLAAPSALGGDGGPVTLSLLDSDGTPVQGVQLTATCSAKIGLQSAPAPTNSKGQTSVVIVANPSLNAYKSPSSGTCTFTTGTGSPSVTINLQGVDLCLSDPTNPLCGFQYSLTVSLLSSGGNAYGSITSSPGGLSCAMTAVTNGATPPVITSVQPTSCSAQFLSETVVSLGATVINGTKATWAGSCVPSTGNPLTATATMNATQNCTVTFSP